MGAITGTLAKSSELCGDYKVYIITAAIASASDDITLTQAVHGISEIAGILGAVVTGGLDTAFTYKEVSFSGLVLTVVTLAQAGGVSTNWSGTTMSISLLGRSE